MEPWSETLPSENVLRAQTDAALDDVDKAWVDMFEENGKTGMSGMAKMQLLDVWKKNLRLYQVAVQFAIILCHCGYTNSIQIPWDRLTGRSGNFGCQVVNQYEADVEARRSFWISYPDDL